MHPMPLWTMSPPQFPFGVQPVINVVAIPVTSRTVQPERPAGDGVISRLGCRVGSAARLPHRHRLDVVAVSSRGSVRHSSPITFAWSPLFTDFSIRRAG